MVFVSSSCFDEVILAEIVFSGSQFITKFEIFYHILTDLILLFLLFCLMTLFQDNHKLVKARFVWWIVGWRLIGVSLRVVSGILPAMFFNQWKWNAWKNLEWFWCRTKVKSGAKKEWFLFIPLFLRERNWCVKNFFPSERNFFLFTCGF